MDNTKRSSGESRDGKHKEGNTLFGGYITPEEKTIAILTSEALHMTFTDMIVEGVRYFATKAGVLVNGQVPPSMLERYEMCLILTKEKIQKGKKAK